MSPRRSAPALLEERVVSKLTRYDLRLVLAGQSEVSRRPCFRAGQHRVHCGYSGTYKGSSGMLGIAMLLRALFNESTSGIVSRYASSIVVSKSWGSLIVWSLDQPLNRLHI